MQRRGDQCARITGRNKKGSKIESGLPRRRRDVTRGVRSHKERPGESITRQSRERRGGACRGKLTCLAKSGQKVIRAISTQRGKRHQAKETVDRVKIIPSVRKLSGG